MLDWLRQLQQLRRDTEPCVLVTVSGCRGSTPRETGAKMIVTRDTVIGSIGGGKLEYSCVRSACEWLQNGNVTGRSKTRRLVLGANCGQCCGGVVEILFEEITPAQQWWIDELTALQTAGIPAAMVTLCTPRARARKWVVTARNCRTQDRHAGDVDRPELTDSEVDWTKGLPQHVLDAARCCLEPGAGARQFSAACDAGEKLTVLIEPVRRCDFEIAVFGAGHVGSACVTIFTQLEATVHWIDNRPDLMNGLKRDDLHTVEIDPPTSYVNQLAAGVYYLVMTHDHALDLELCAAILQRSDSSYCGLIGSGAKRRRFLKRLTAAGLLPEQLARLTCPIGIDLIGGKKPMEIAVAVAAELLNLRETSARRDHLTPVGALAAQATAHTKSL
ncbi:MAG: xanthine dehydrogenase accessory protein XdhC [Gammaproteobacteria bacterium]|nr:xanthine dehydrogenase accessory protein XdhC [Gammaproteobacteria bacterium]